MVFTQLNLHCFSHCELCKGKCIDDQNDDNIDEPRDILKQRAYNDNKVYSFSLEHRNSALNYCTICYNGDNSRDL